MARASARVDDRIVRLFLKMVGAECGLYNPRTQSFVADLITRPLYQENLRQVREVLETGRLTARDLEDLICERYRAGERQALLSAILPRLRRLDADENLMEDGVVYQHAQLYVRTAPSFLLSRDRMEPAQPGSQERRERYTLRELLDYYYLRAGGPPAGREESRTKRDLGALRYLLDAWRLDELLHAIDLAAAAGKLGSVFKLEDYLPEARELVQIRIARRHG